jgi:hypothetical protein
MSEIATIPSPTITIFWRWIWLGLGLPSTGSPYRNPSSTGIAGMTETEQCEDEYNTSNGYGTHGTQFNFKKIKSLIPDTM